MVNAFIIIYELYYFCTLSSEHAMRSSSEYILIVNRSLIHFFLNSTLMIQKFCVCLWAQRWCWYTYVVLNTMKNIMFSVLLKLYFIYTLYIILIYWEIYIYVLFILFKKNIYMPLTLALSTIWFTNVVFRLPENRNAEHPSSRRARSTEES